MYTCVSCHQELPADKFTMRKRPPIVPYKACKDCQVEYYNISPRSGKSFKNEMKVMREKTESLRLFNDAEGLELHKRWKSGVTHKALAEEFNCSQSTVAKAIRRAGNAQD